MTDGYRIVRDRLASGIRVVTVEMSHVHSVAIALFARVGSRYERRSHSGLSHFLEHMFFRGSARYATSVELHAAVEHTGGTLQATTGRDLTSFFLRVHPDALPLAVELLGEIFTRPRFANIEVERQLILEELRGDFDEHGRDICIDDISRRMIWPTHPLGFKIIGNRRNVLSFTAPDVRRHWRRFYVGPNLVLCVAGRVERKDVLRAVRGALREIPDGRPIHPSRPHERQRAPQIYLRDNDDSQADLLCSFRALSEVDRDYPALQVLRRLLDDGVCSRLQAAICEEHGLAYDVSAGTDCYVDAGVLDIDVSIAVEKSERVVGEILKQVRRIATEEVTEEELDRVKRRHALELLTLRDGVAEMAGWFGGGELLDLPELSLEALHKKVLAIRKADIRRVARRIFRPDRLNLVGLGRFTRSQRRRLARICTDFG